MSYNGSGTFNINTTGQPVVAGTVITATAFNLLTADLATGLTTAITKDGQTATTARIPFAQGINSTLVTDATNTTSGSIITAGGVGIAKALYVGTTANVTGVATFSAQPIFSSLTASSAVATDASKGLVSVTNTGTGNNVLATAPTIASLNLTTALTIASAAGTAGQALTSGGSGVAPTWTTIGASAATPTALGTVYGNTLSGGLYTTAVGYESLNSNTAGVANTAFGYRALKSNTTDSNTAFGYNALTSTTTGGSNIGIGVNAGGSLTTGGSNIFMGEQCGNSTTTATNNVCIGRNSGAAVTTGGSNTLLGTDTAPNLTTGSLNVMIGRYAGQSLATGSYNIHIGYGTNTSSSSVSDEIVLSTSGNTGKGANTGFISPNGGGVYQGNNSSSWSTTSDFRLKKNIVDNTEGLDKITQIQVRNFEYKLPEEVTELDSKNAIDIGGVQLGVIAQELQAVLPNCVKQESTGVLTVDSDNLTWYLINAVKELKAELDALKAKVA